uniref:Ig-like domain-containing protein n=1 Tax=Denticeps clupeoides TaxID=299321 RepID=A0AAY4AER7_9TELE
MNATLMAVSPLGHCLSQDVLPTGSLNGAIGKNVMFKTNIIPSPKPFLSVAWSYNNTNIITHTNAGNTTASKYEGRIFLEVSTGSLELRNLRQNDSGIYSVSIIPALGPQMLGRTTLRVYGPTSLLLAGKSSANLTCEGTGSIVTTEWTRNGQPLHPSNGTTFSSDNKTVFISTVERDDAGVYQCKLSNPVSTTAANYSMVVNYGPENVKISGLTEVNNGLKATFTCSAASEPPANFSWSFNMKETDVTNATFTIEKASGFNTGNYTCTAWNRVTNVKDSATHEFSVTGTVLYCTVFSMSFLEFRLHHIYIYIYIYFFFVRELQFPYPKPQSEVQKTLY